MYIYIKLNLSIRGLGITNCRPFKIELSFLPCCFSLPDIFLHCMTVWSISSLKTLYCGIVSWYLDLYINCFPRIIIYDWQFLGILCLCRLQKLSLKITFPGIYWIALKNWISPSKRAGKTSIQKTDDLLFLPLCCRKCIALTVLKQFVLGER